MTTFKIGVTLKFKEIIRLIGLTFLLIGFTGFNNALCSSKMVPGDVIQLNYPLDSTISGNYTIDSQYEIHFKNSLYVSLKDATTLNFNKKIKRAMEPYYNDVETIRSRILEKKIRIRILGQVAKPGWYILEPNSNIQDLIEAGGGVSIGAQLDALILYSTDGKKTRNIDLRRYLEGDLKVANVKLYTDDVLFVPKSPIFGAVARNIMPFVPPPDENRDNIINIFGMVRNPGAFEVNTVFNILDALALAGGTVIPANSSVITDLEDIRVIRHNSEDSTKKIRSFNLVEYFKNGDGEILLDIQAGDDIMVHTKKANVEDKGKSLVIMGSVRKPGNYEIVESIRLDQIVARAGGFDCDSLKCHSRKDSIVLMSWNKDSTFTKSSFNYLKWEQNPETSKIPNLKANDHVLVLNQSFEANRDVMLTQQAHIHGEVNKPGSYFVGDKMNLMEFLAGAGGISLPSGHPQVVVVRFVKGQRLQLVFDQDEFFLPPSENKSECVSEMCRKVPLILPGDQLIVRERPSIRWMSWFNLVVKATTVILTGYTIANTVDW